VKIVKAERERTSKSPPTDSQIQQSGQDKVERSYGLDEDEEISTEGAKKF